MVFEVYTGTYSIFDIILILGPYKIYVRNRNVDMYGCLLFRIRLRLMCLQSKGVLSSVMLIELIIESLSVCSSFLCSVVARNCS